jgi:hypothetical protein
MYNHQYMYVECDPDHLKKSDKTAVEQMSTPLPAMAVKIPEKKHPGTNVMISEFFAEITGDKIGRF